MVESEMDEGVWVLRFNASPLNTLTLELLSQLRESIDQACRDGTVQGIVITGDAAHFSTGADVGLFRQLASTEDAVRLCQVFQATFQALEDCAKPVVAALTGRVIGGALELAMACHYRVAGSSSRFTMPEVKLGINPGAGGTQRLPRLIGPAAALKMLLTAETVDAERALALGLVDVVCEDQQVIARARDLVRSMPPPRKTREQTDKVQDTSARDAAFDEAERRLTGARPEIIAPWKIMEAVKAGLNVSFEAGLLKEQQVFAQCMQSLGTRNKIYLFFATKETSKIPELASAKTATLTQAAVVGMGSMGTDIAHALIAAGVRVTVLDQSSAALAKGTEKIRDSIEQRLSQGKLSAPRAEQMLTSLSTTTRWDDVGQADLVIESVFEDVAAKRSVMDHLEAICLPGTILATNTSTIPLDELAAAMRHPQRLIGMHFFNPAHRMPLVEIIRRHDTPREILATALAWAKQLQKTPVLVASREGFLVTRVFVPYVQEAFWLLEEGATATAIDAAAAAFGFPMGPLELIDMTGLDILTHSQRVLAAALPRHGSLSPIADRLVARGQLGQKTGSGIYRYEPGSHAPLECAATTQVIASVQRERGCTPRVIDQDEITERLVLRMVSEAFYALEEGVARCQSDVDVAAVLGIGFPDFRGGVLKYANDRGLNRVLARLHELAGRWGERFSPCQLMQTLEGVS
ncbi:MAG: 3-hydroxyacyl-CoA dehydrogenase NAD-binding domain-containing protein [Pirellulaceae bacterium]